MNNFVLLRPVQTGDLEIFFQQQLDETANHMAAFTSKNPADRDAFLGRWEKILSDKGILARTIVVNGNVAGNISSHGWFGDLEVGYWLGREFWGQGIASQALQAFLEEQTTRPIFARAAADNLASLKVLQKCGFVIFAEETSFAEARGTEIKEFILRLD